MSAPDDDDLGLGPDCEDDFHDAADHVARVVSSSAASVSDAVKLRLYGYYKQATAGPCSATKPAFWDLAGKAKWSAWSDLGSMAKEDAMLKYVEEVKAHVPGWQSGGAGGGKGKGGVMSQRVSSFQHEEGGDGGPRQQGGAATLHELVSGGDIEAVRRALLQQQQGPQPSGANGGVDCRDDQGCTPLHFAADRGLAPIAQLLLDHGADVNAKDADGQSPLHYAAICGRQELCSLLVAAGADVALEDADGATAKDAAPSGWPAAIWQRQQPQPAS